MICFYEIDDDYIQYMQKIDSRVVSSKVGERNETRKYIGVLLHNKEYKYFIPLSSYKPEKYDLMHESHSFKKIGGLAVLRINNMIPVIDEVIHKIIFQDVVDEKYRHLLMNEYRLIKPREKEIRLSSRIVYYFQLKDENKDKPLYKLCCDFKALEEGAKEYSKKFVCS